MKKRICLFAAVFAFLAMAAVAFAENNVAVDVTSEPIKYHAECDKAGGFTFKFDHGTRFVSGDQITADLPMNVSLCQSIDFIAGIARGGADPLPYSNAFVLPNIDVQTLGPLTGQGTLLSGFGGVVFWVHGVKGTQRIYIDILSDSALDGDDSNEEALGAGAPWLEFQGTDIQTSQLYLDILDQAVYTSPSGLFTDRNLSVAPASSVTDYDLRTVKRENTLCINVSQYDNEYVKASIDSKEDKYKFDPSDPQIAHVVSALDIAFATCAKNECGTLMIPVPGEQSDGTCYAIDNEAGEGVGAGSYATEADGYCPGTHRNNKVLIQETTGRPFDAGIYQIQLEIVVNGATGDQGAYFAGPIGYYSDADTDEICAGNVTALQPGTVYFNSLNESNVYDIDAIGTNANITPLGDQDCSVAAVNRITKVKTVEVALFNGTDQDFLWVDIPDIIRDAALFTEDELLEVRVTLLKTPCGTLFTGDWCIGVLGCETSINPDACYEYMRVFPYFGMKGNFKNYIAITNTTDTAGVYTIMIYEQDGDVFSASIPVAAQNLAVMDLHSLTVTTVASAGGGVFGNAKSYGIVTGNTDFFGTAFMINATSGQAFDSGSGDISHKMVTCP